MRSDRQQQWLDDHTITDEWLMLARQVIHEVLAGEAVMDAIRTHPLPAGGFLGKYVLVEAYHRMVKAGEIVPDAALLESLRMKPMRTLSGVTTVTVLTKPYPCPGKCIFCPTDVRMPKSYLPDEPGAMRGLEHDFDPIAQVRSRIVALQNLGHPTDKIELLILGGTWSAYKRDYQEWFVARCLDAMNEPTRGPVKDSEAGPADLMRAQQLNEIAPHRNVGLVIETRPDEITADELRWLRHLGVTKVQLGAQSLDDRILQLNQRGHDAACTLQAVELLRAAGFKVVLHWMPNLLGATPESDRTDFQRLWVEYCPDELKIYPNQLLANAELYQNWLRGEFAPYTTPELVSLIADIKPSVPRYCRINRVIRDIPSTNVVAGNRTTSLRQDIHAELERRGTACQCIRCREVRGKPVQAREAHLLTETYRTRVTTEHFISFVTSEDKLAGFLRLSLPEPGAPDTGLPELHGAALIREVHVYGQSLALGSGKTGAAQHSGLGTQLLAHAEELARHRRFQQLAVISAIGTRRYYLDRGFQRDGLYLVKAI